MELTLKERKKLTRLTAKKYRQAPKPEKTKIPDVFTDQTGYGRKYAVRIFSERGRFTVCVPRHARLVHLYGQFVHLYGQFVHLYGQFVHLYGQFVHLYGEFVHLYGKLVHLYGKLVHLYGRPGRVYARRG